MNQVEYMLDECEATNQLSDKEIEDINDFRKKTSVLFEIINDENEIINYNLEVLNNQEGWITEKEKGKIKISY